LKKVDPYDLNEDESGEYYFKSGYSYYVTDNIDKASKNLFEVKDKETKYYVPALYYYSHIAYQKKNYETALQGFEQLKNDELFASIVPYYITRYITTRKDMRR